MRENLFRGKAINEDLSVSEKWIVGSLCNEACSPIRIKGETNYTKCPHISIYDADSYLKGFGNLGAPKFYKVHPETVGQYIYEKDINGNRIFEDDIIAYKGERYKIGCVDNGKRFIALRENGVFAFVPWERVEIIGNIHDNPELLKGGAE